MSIEEQLVELKTNVLLFRQDDPEWILLVSILEKLIKNEKDII